MSPFLQGDTIPLREGHMRCHLQVKHLTLGLSRGATVVVTAAAAAALPRLADSTMSPGGQSHSFCSCLGKGVGRSPQEGPSPRAMPDPYPVQQHTAQNSALTNTRIPINMKINVYGALCVFRAPRQLLSLVHLSMFLPMVLEDGYPTMGQGPGAGGGGSACEAESLISSLSDPNRDSGMSIPTSHRRQHSTRGVEWLASDHTPSKGRVAHTLPPQGTNDKTKSCVCPGE